MDQQQFETNVVTGADLLALSENVRGWEKGACCQQLDAYLHSSQKDRVCLLFGLRRTGKATMLRQAVLDMAPENAAKTAYIKATVLDIAALNRDMKRPRAGELNFDDDSVNAEDAGGYCTAGDDENGGQTPTGIQAAVRGWSV